MSDLRRIVMDTFAQLFARPQLAKLNKALLYLGARGLGLYNLSSDVLSGERRFLERELPRDLKTVFDVGANVGDYAAHVRAAFPDATIFAFEPHPRTFEHLLRRHGSDVKAFNVALSDRAGVLDLFDLADSGTQLASLSAEALEALKRPIVVQQVEATTLDQFCDTHGITSIDLLKLDTEGFELSILRGAQRMLEENRISYIQFEFNEMNAATHAHLRDFKKLLKNHELFRLLPSGLLPLSNESTFYTELYGYQNVVALPTG